MRNKLCFVIIITLIASATCQQMAVKCEETDRKFQQTTGNFPYTTTMLYPPLLPDKSWPGFERIELYKTYIILKKMSEAVGIINCKNGEAVDEKIWQNIPPQVLGKTISLNVDGSETLFTGSCHQVDKNKYLVQATSGSTKTNLINHVCLYEDYKLKWSIPVDSYHVVLLTNNRALIGKNHVKLVNLETGDVCFEYKSRYQVSCKFDNELAIIDNNLIIAIETGEVLWSLNKKYNHPVYNELFFSNERILEIDGGRFSFYSRLTGKLEKEFVDRNSTWDAIGVAGSLAYGSSGNRFFCYDLENKKYLISYADKIFLGYNVSFAHDVENIYIGDEIGIICYSIKDRKFSWKKDFSSLKKLQEYNGNSYMNAINRNMNIELIETLYLVKNNSLIEIISTSLESGISKLYWQSLFSLIPMEKGILHIPYAQKKDNQPCLYDYQTRKQKMIYNIPSWGEYPNIPSFMLNKNTLVICCDGMSVNILDLETGENKNILLLGAKGNHKISIVINELYAYVNLGYESYVVDLKEKILTKVFDSQHAVTDPLFIYNEWLVASGDFKVPGIKIINLNTFEIIRYNHSYLGTTENAIIAYNPEDKYFYKRFFSDILNEDRIQYKRILGSNSCTFNNYHCTTGSIANLEDGSFIQKLTLTPNKPVFPCEGKLSLNENGTIYTYSPCQTFSIKRIDKSKFQVELTRDEKQAGKLFGKAFLIPIDENGKYFPAMTNVTNNFFEINLSKKGQKQLLKFDLPNINKSIFWVDNSISKKDKLGILIISNGLLDTINSELSDFNKEGRPLFDGFPTSLDKQEAFVLTVWNK